MTTFLQLHLLTVYPPACLNRDDLNRPKTAVMGGVPRLRVSSQSLKRAWRTSEQFETALKGHVGTRTKLKGVHIYEHLTGAGVREKDAKEWAQAIAGRFGKLKGKKEDKPLNDLEIEQLAHFSPEEESAIAALAENARRRETQADRGRTRTAPQAAHRRRHRPVRPHAGRQSGIQHRGRLPGRPRRYRAPRGRGRRLLHRRGRPKHPRGGRRLRPHGRAGLRGGAVLQLPVRELRRSCASNWGRNWRARPFGR